MKLRTGIIALASLLTLSFAVQAQDWSITIGHGPQGPQSNLGGQKKQLLREISRQSSRLFAYARQMAFPHDVRERIALDNFARFDREVSFQLSLQGPINKQEIRRIEQAYQFAKPSFRDLRAFDYYRNEFKDLNRDLQTLFSFADVGPTPYPVPGPYPFPTPGPGYGVKQIVSCSSFFDSYTECLVDGQIMSAKVRSQHSNSACRVGVDWGFQYNVLWVNNGCRATFEAIVR